VAASSASAFSRGDVAIHHQRVALNLSAVCLRVAAMINPGYLQPPHIAAVNLFQGGEMGVAMVAEIHRPALIRSPAGAGQEEAE
jgi:hypothetical protein